MGTRDRIAPGDAADDGDDARGRGGALVLVVGDEEADLLRVLAGVEEELDALAGGELALLVLLLGLARAAARAESRPKLPQLGGERAQARALLGGSGGCFRTHSLS